MKGVHQMREDHTEDMELNKEMEDIRQVPLEPGSRTAPGRERPVGASYTGGAARPGRGAPGMDEGMGRAARPRSGASGLDEGVGRAARPGNGAPGLDEGMGRACDREEARRRPDPRDMDVPGRGEIGKRRKSVPGRHGRFQRRKRAGEAGRGRREPGRPKPGINGPASRLLNQRRVKSRSGRMTRQGSSPLIPREKYHGAAKKGKVFPLWRSCLC